MQTNLIHVINVLYIFFIITQKLLFSHYIYFPQQRSYSKFNKQTNKIEILETYSASSLNGPISEPLWFEYANQNEVLVTHFKVI